MDNKIKKIGLYVFVILSLIFTFGYISSAVYMHYVEFLKTNNYMVFFDASILKDYNTYIRGLAATIVISLFYILNSPRMLTGGVLKNKINRVEAGLENADWMSKAEINSTFNLVDFNALPTLKFDGIPVNAEYNKLKKNLLINFAKPMHTLVLGATGSGKTTGFINPMIQILANSAAGSSMICTDPKGELYQSHSKLLDEKGYSVLLLDLRDTYNSYKWNPLTPIFRIYQEYIKKANEIYQRTDSLDASGLTLQDARENYKDEWYEFDGCAYSNKKALLDAVTVTRQKLYDEAYEDLNDIVSIICPIESEKDPIWDRGARSIVFAIALAMLEDSENPDLDMTEEKFSFFNINKALGKSEDNYKDLRDYFAGRNELSKAVNMAKQVLTTAPETLASYMTNAYDKLSIFNDSGIAALTSGLDIDLTSFGKKPTALFIKVPDEKDTRHKLAAMFMVSLYKALVKEASKYPDLSLPRNVYYLMDEFGNMPKINKFENMITVGRSRKVWFIIVVQAYAQLDTVYGEKVSEIIKGNCPYKIFIGSNDMKTCEEFSKSCGNMTVSTVSASKAVENKSSDLNVSQQVQQRPLIYPAELQKLNNGKDTGNVIVVTLGNNPLRGKFTPSYKCPLFKFGTMEVNNLILNAFYEEEVYYDLAERNIVVLGDEQQNNQAEGNANAQFNLNQAANMTNMMPGNMPMSGNMANMMPNNMQIAGNMANMMSNNVQNSDIQDNNLNQNSSNTDDSYNINNNIDNDLEDDTPIGVQQENYQEDFEEDLDEDLDEELDDEEEIQEDSQGAFDDNGVDYSEDDTPIGVQQENYQEDFEEDLDEELEEDLDEELDDEIDDKEEIQEDSQGAFDDNGVDYSEDDTPIGVQQENYQEDFEEDLDEELDEDLDEELDDEINDEIDDEIDDKEEIQENSQGAFDSNTIEYDEENDVADEEYEEENNVSDEEYDEEELYNQNSVSHKLEKSDELDELFNSLETDVV